MATVKTVLVKGRSNRSGKFPLVVQVLHKRRKKVVYTGFSIPDTLFDPVKGRVIDGGENTPESIRRINNRCESISRVLLKCISMIEKKSREYEIEDVFRTYGVLTRDSVHITIGDIQPPDKSHFSIHDGNFPMVPVIGFIRQMVETYRQKGINLYIGFPQFPDKLLGQAP